MEAFNTLEVKAQCLFFFFYPGSDPLNVSQSGQPLGSICVRRVGSILMYQRGHLQGGKAQWRLFMCDRISGKKQVRPHVCVQSHLSDEEGKVPVRNDFCYRSVHQTFKV